MPTTTNVSNLVINKVSDQAVYDAMVAADLVNENELYLIADDYPQIKNMTASDTTVALEENYFYIWPEMSTLTITCPAVGGPFGFRFTSGATATTLSLSGITMPDDFTVEANMVYEINVYEGYGLAITWSVS